MIDARSMRAALVLLMFLGPLAHASDGLVELLNKARAHDADFRAATAARDAAVQSRVIGRALYLPTLSVSYEVGNSQLSRDYLNGAPPLNYKTTSRTTAWRITQPIIDLAKWSAWKQEDSRAALAELKFVEASTELVLRLCRSVFDTLLASDNLALAKAQKAAISSQKKEAEKLRAAGMLSMTEVEDTRAKEMQAQANLMEATYGLELRKRELSRIVGELPEGSPRPFASFVPTPPEPDDIGAWIKAAEEANPKILTAAMAVEVASHGVDKAKAGLLPQLDLIGSSTVTRNPNKYTGLEDSNGVALRLSMALFEGGRTLAIADQASALRTQAREELDSTRRESGVKVAEAFLGIANAQAKIAALEQALVASETTLKGALAGRQAGIRTHTEVLSAQQQVFAVKRDLNKERYNHLLAGVQLKALAGRLTDADLVALDQLMAKE